MTTGKGNHMNQAKVITQDATYADRAVAHTVTDGIDHYTVWVNATVTGTYTTRLGKTLYRVTLAKCPSDLNGASMLATEIRWKGVK